MSKGEGEEGGRKDIALGEEGVVCRRYVTGGRQDIAFGITGFYVEEMRGWGVRAVGKERIAREEQNKRGERRKEWKCESGG